MEKVFSINTFKKDFHKPSLEAENLRLLAKIEQLEKDKKNLKLIIRAFNASNTRQNSI
ncbi:hypothetical protein UFOVP87_33 [uncultured Caudovirales phage]|uniref:Uncharacterized protein n=1 Tax=uncultured Caudovirales phage TaxID=2100421 RepID=A0A6J5KX35_9CAUD|nr:hypothetical protein UFOVP87_33 [uncultured Caudovirales phage]